MESYFVSSEIFREKLKGKGIMFLFEVIPPPQHLSREAIHQKAERIVDLIQDLPIDAVNLPEVRNETRNGGRMITFRPKIPPRRFARLIRSRMRKNHKPDTEFLINRCVVYTHRENQKKWLESTLKNFAFRSLVLVGGESSRITYPGPTVIEAARMASSLEVNPLNLGGITIPTRRKNHPLLDEPYRLLSKSLSGISFFISQILLEIESMKTLFSDYWALCQKKNEQPCRIFLSFAPVSGKRDLDFLRWLGVEIPLHVERFLLQNPEKTLPRSLHLACTLWEDFLTWLSHKKIAIPVGINVEHVMSYNLEASIALLQELKGIVGK
ncbi:MAG: hypothetical protein V2G48_04435 [bacterium JZ-2024 1]